MINTMSGTVREFIEHSRAIRGRADELLRRAVNEAKTDEELRDAQKAHWEATREIVEAEGFILGWTVEYRFHDDNSYANAVIGAKLNAAPLPIRDPDDTSFARTIDRLDVPLDATIASIKASAFWRATARRRQAVDELFAARLLSAKTDEARQAAVADHEAEVARINEEVIRSQGERPLETDEERKAAARFAEMTRVDAEAIRNQILGGPDETT